MSSVALTRDWRHDLPSVRGELTFDAPLKDLSWFRVGGPADVLFRPADETDLQIFLKCLPRDIPVTLLGVGSNLLIRDGGVRGVVIRLGKPFSTVLVQGDSVIAGAGASDVNVAMAAYRAGLGGLEFLRGIPGTVGGALRMNAGAYGREIADVLISARAIDRHGEVHFYRLGDMGYSYRHSELPEDLIFLTAIFRAGLADKAAVKARMDEIGAERETSQPVKTSTGGSTFKNPAGGKAWELIDAAGCRGLSIGGAQVSEQHCNFLINTGTATAADLESLGEEVRHRVQASQGVSLEWEIRRIGEPLGGAR